MGLPITNSLSTAHLLPLTSILSSPTHFTHWCISPLYSHHPLTLLTGVSHFYTLITHSLYSLVCLTSILSSPTHFTHWCVSPPYSHHSLTILTGVSHLYTLITHSLYSLVCLP